MGFIATPLTDGRLPNQRERLALDKFLDRCAKFDMIPNTAKESNDTAISFFLPTI